MAEFEYEIVDNEVFYTSITIDLEEDLKDRKDKESKYREYGKYFGYPECCIDFFCAVPYCGILTLDYNHWASGSGYVPCPSCMKKPKEEIIQLINNNRMKDTTFSVK